MTRKDYVAIARAFQKSQSYNSEERGMWQSLMLNIADVFATDNPKFNRERFYLACEVTP